MANAVARLIVNPYPYGSDDNSRRQIYNGVVQIESGNYPAGGIPLLWQNMVGAPKGGPVLLDSPFYNPVVAAFLGHCGLYDYSYQGAEACIGGLGATATPFVAVPAYCSNVALTTNVCTITANNNFVAGQQVTLNGFTGATFLNGQTVTVIATGLTAAVFEFNFTNANYSSTADVGMALPYPQSQAIPTINVTSFFITSNVLSLNAVNAVVAGQTVTLSGFNTGTYLNGQTVTVAASPTGTQFTASFTHANAGSSGSPVLDPGTATPQLCYLHINPQAGVTNAVATSTSYFITSNLASVNATNTFSVGETVLLQAFTTGTYFNGQIVTITAATGAQYSFNFVHANVGSSGSPQADTTGTATRTDIVAGAAVPGGVLSDFISFRVEFAKG